jgi:hypothetical protein
MKYGSLWERAPARYRESTLEMRKKHHGIAVAAQQVAADNGPPCSEGSLRRLERLGVVHPARDQWGRRLFGDDDIAAARRYLNERHEPRADHQSRGPQ